MSAHHQAARKPTDANGETQASSEKAIWLTINRKLIAKLIAELSYEECFTPRATVDNYYELSLRSGVRYSFSAWLSCWGLLRINETSLSRNGTPCTDATQFLIDAQQEIGANDITLGNMLEECYQTLAGDMTHYQKLQSQTAASLCTLSCDELQGYLDGHPKATLNKGRLGWGINALAAYSPEAQQPFQLRWIAIVKSVCTIGLTESTAIMAMPKTAMSEKEWQHCEVQIANELSTTDFDREDYVILPVHPWQWQQVIQIHHAHLIASKALIDLGELGHRFLPLQSIRTLANIDHPSAPNIKLPITILNTSCYRGIPGRYITIGAALSQWLDTLCHEDSLLQQRGTHVLQEPLGISCKHSQFSQIDNAPYRYKETLGVIWRESIYQSLDNNEQAMLVAALLQCDNQGGSIVGELIKQSGKTADEWCRAYFNAVVIPLYHLLCGYGIGLVAHGQNLTLILENHTPKRLAIKDLQGDCRLVDLPFKEYSSLPDEVFNTLDKLPAEHLLHDLVTGHFVTVLRHLSALMQEKQLINEDRFYRALRDELKRYQTQHPELIDRFELFPLFSESIHKLCINRVRFEQGYQDTAQRPIPILGNNIANPLLSFS